MVLRPLQTISAVSVGFVHGSVPFGEDTSDCDCNITFRNKLTEIVSAVEDLEVVRPLLGDCDNIDTRNRCVPELFSRQILCLYTSTLGVVLTSKARHLAEHAGAVLTVARICIEGETSLWPWSYEGILDQLTSFSNAFETGLRKFEWKWNSMLRQRVSGSIRVACLLSTLARPQDIDVVRQTWGADCNSLRFFVAGPLATNHSDVHDLTSPSMASILNASEGQILQDRREYAWDAIDGPERRGNLVHKVLSMLFVEATMFNSEADWFCRFDTDALFSVERFQRFVVKQQLSSSTPIVLGHLNRVKMAGISHPSFDGGAGICLNRKALHRLRAVLAHSLRTSGYIMRPQSFEDSQFLRCAFLPGVYDDRVLAHCFRKARIQPYAFLEDALGRPYFSRYKMPCQASPPTIDGVPPAAVVRMWAKEKKVFRLLRCWPLCNLHPHLWTAGRDTISYHDYKKPSELRAAYRQLIGSSPCTQPWGLRIADMIVNRGISLKRHGTLLMFRE